MAWLCSIILLPVNLRFLLHRERNSGPQSFWHQGLFSWKIIFPQNRGKRWFGDDSSDFLFKKIRDTKGTFHEKMGSTKDRNSMDLTEAEDIKKR